MKLVFRPAIDKGFVEQLTRRNMAAYYAQLGISWDCTLFDKNWNEFENYEIAVNGCSVGVLRLSHDGTAYYIGTSSLNRLGRARAWALKRLTTQLRSHGGQEFDYFGYAFSV